MQRLAPSIVAPRHEDAPEITQFRVNTLQWVLWTLPAVAMLIVVITVMDFRGTPAGLGLLVPPLLAVSYVGHSVLERNVTGAAMLTIASLLAALSFAAWVSPDGQLATLFCLIVLIAGATLQARGLLATAVVVTAILAVGWVGPLRLATPEVALTSVALCVGAAVLSWLATGPFRVALDWAWQHYETALEMAEELRDRQGELSRVVARLSPEPADRSAAGVR
jgi:hypothetical protein